MSAVEKIRIAEDKVADLQEQLVTVGSVLEKAETVVVAGEKTGRGLRRFIKLLLIIGVAAVIVMIIKKVMAGKSGGLDEPTFEPAPVDSEAASEAAADDEDADNAETDDEDDTAPDA